MKAAESLPATDARVSTILWWGVLLLIALTPLPFGSNRPWAWSAMALWAFSLLIGWTITLAFERTRLVWRIAFFPLLLSMGFVIIWIGLTVLPDFGPVHPIWQIAAEQLGHRVHGRITISVDATLIALMRLLAYLSIFWLSLQFCREPRRAEQLLILISWTGLLYALYGLINYFIGNAYLLWFERWASLQDVTATFVNRNHYATYAALGMLSSAVLAIRAFRSAWRLSDRSQPTFARTIECLAGRPLLYYVIMLVIGMAWLQTHSRMGAAAGAVGMFAMLALMRATGMVRSHLALWVLAFLLGFFLLQVSGDITIARLGQTGEIDRLPIFAIVSDQIRGAPLTGSGYGSFAQAFAVYRDLRLPSAAAFTEAHNSYLELAAEIGLPAAGAMVLTLVYCTLLCLIAAFRRQKERSFPIFAVAASLVVGVHALMDFSLQIPAIAILYAAILGMGVAQSWSGEARAGAQSPSSETG